MPSVLGTYYCDKKQKPNNGPGYINNKYNIISAWLFNEHGGGTCYDMNKRNNALFQSTNTIIDAGAFKSCSVSLNGSSSNYFDCGNDSTLQLSNGSLLVWLKTSGSGSSFRGVAVKQNAYSIFLLDGVFGLYDWGSVNFRSSGIDIRDNRWHQLCVSFQSGITNGTILYLDGVPVLTTTFTVSNQSVNLQIGSGGVGGQEYSGLIDHVIIANRSWSGGEVARLYTNAFDFLHSNIPDFYANLPAAASAGMTIPYNTKRSKQIIRM